MTAFPLSCNYIFKKLQKEKIQENSETAMSWAGQRNFFMGEEIGGEVIDETRLNMSW